MRKAFLLVLSIVTMAVQALAGQDSLRAVCPTLPLRAERLPDLIIPRAGHATFVVNGEPTVVGGHTSGFIPTATAEYYRDGEWHLMETAYTHDQGICVPMSDGRVMLAGGHERELGIGQTFTVEMYHPDSHTFEGYGCLDRKRSIAGGIELDSGRVIISGNWYADDGMEVFTGERQFSSLRPVSQMRSKPYLLRTANDNAIVFSTTDTHGEPLDSIIIDRVLGEPFTVPLFSTWRPKILHHPLHNYDCCIGDYTHLITVEDSTGQLAIAHVQDEDFRLLPTVSPVPMERDGQQIHYFTSVIADQELHRGFVVGHDDEYRFYVLSIDYGNSPAQLTLYYTKPQDSIGVYAPMLMPSGDLLIAGGSKDSNFVPFASVLLLKTGHQEKTIPAKQASSNTWLWIGIGFLASTALLIYIYRTLQRRKPAADLPAEAGITDPSNPLMQRICQLMEQELVFQRADLKVSDVAQALNTNRTYVSNCIKEATGQNFTQFVNTYRIKYAKELLVKYPDKKVIDIAAASGFANETSFFRSFKAATGLSPRNWPPQND